MIADESTSDFEFNAEMSRLRDISKALFERPAGKLGSSPVPIFDQLLADLTPTARRAVLAVWPAEEVAA